MQAFHGDPKIKSSYLTRVRYHEQMNHLSKAFYYEERHGRVRACAVGAMLHDPRGGHVRFPGELGIPEAVAHLIDSTFEYTTRPYGRTLATRALEAIPVGADLRGVPYHLVLWMLSAEGHDLWRSTNTLGREVLARVESLYRRRIAGDTVTPADWGSAALYARDRGTYAWEGSAAYYATHAARAAADPGSPTSAATVAEKAVEARTTNVTPDTRARVARASWSAIGDKLVALLAAAPQGRLPRREADLVRAILAPVG